MDFEKAQEAVDKMSEFIKAQFEAAVNNSEEGTISEMWGNTMSEIVDSCARFISALR